MVTVYVWNMKLDKKAVVWGHASMLVNEQYISWWPSPENRVPTSKVSSNIYAALPIPNRQYSDDVRDEGSPPDHTIIIKGLDEASIMTWWRGKALSYGGANELQGPVPPWETLGDNCSKIVATALKAGGGDKYVFPTRTYKFVYIWMPHDVRWYAKSIAEGIKKKTAK